MKSLGISYILWFGFLFGAAGLHRMYNGYWLTGILYFFTWGFFGIGTLFDMLFMGSLVEGANKRIARQIKSYQ